MATYEVGRSHIGAPSIREARVIALDLIDKGEPQPIEIRFNRELYAWVELRHPVKSDEIRPVYFRKDVRWG